MGAPGERAGPATVTSTGRPRILFVGPEIGARGGIAQFSAGLASSIRRDADAEMLTFRRLYPRWTRPGREPADPNRRPPMDASQPAHPALVPWLPWTWVAGARHLARLQPHLVVMQWWHPLFGPCLGFLAKRATHGGATVAFVCHNDRPHEPFPLWRSLTRLALARADILFALSSPVASRLGEMVPGTPIQVLPNPPNLGVGDGAGPPKWADRWSATVGPTILFFGYVRRYKGLDDLIDALPLVRRELPATLVVAGPFIQRPSRFRRRAQRLGVGEHVRLYPGYVPDEAVPSLFALSDVVALPYRSASQSGVLPLAAAFGTPVVATRTGGIPEAIGDMGVLVPPGDVVALAEGIVRALRSPPSPPPEDAGAWDRWRDELLAAIRYPRELLDRGAMT